MKFFRRIALKATISAPVALIFFTANVSAATPPSPSGTATSPSPSTSRAATSSSPKAIPYTWDGTAYICNYNYCAVNYNGSGFDGNHINMLHGRQIPGGQWNIAPVGTVSCTNQTPFSPGSGLNCKYDGNEVAQVQTYDYLGDYTAGNCDANIDNACIRSTQSNSWLTVLDNVSGANYYLINVRATNYWHDNYGGNSEYYWTYVSAGTQMQYLAARAGQEMTLTHF